MIGARPAALGIAISCAVTLPAWAAPSFEDSVVRVITTHQAYDTLNPWAKRKPDTRSHQAVVIDERTILTTASAVRDATLIRVEARGGPDQFAARVALVDPDVNLALMTVDDEAFFDDLRPVKLARHMPTEGVVTTATWRNGQLQAVEGRVVRIGVRDASTGNVKHTTLEISTDLPSGSSSQPVFHKRNLVGLTTYQGDGAATVQSVELVRQFLELSREETYPGFPVFGARYQLVKSEADAAWLGLESPAGVLVRNVPAGSSACGVLRPRDVLLSVDGHDIDGNGKVEHPRYGLLPFTYLLADGHHAGESVPIRYLRDGNVQGASMPLRVGPPGLNYVPGPRYNYRPGYLIIGGMVMIEFDRDYTLAHGSKWRKSIGLRLRTTLDLQGIDQTRDQRRAIVISNVLPDAYNLGYHGVRHSIVHSVNERPIDSLADIVEALEHPVDGFAVFEVSSSLGTREIVLDANTLEEADRRIKETYKIGRLRRAAPEPPALECDR